MLRTAEKNGKHEEAVKYLLWIFDNKKIISLREYRQMLKREESK